MTNKYTMEEMNKDVFMMRVCEGRGWLSKHPALKPQQIFDYYQVEAVSCSCAAPGCIGWCVRQMKSRNDCELTRTMEGCA